MTEFIQGLVFVFLSGIMFFFSWNEVASLFSFIPPEMQHLSFKQSICILFIIRTLTMICRFQMPEPAKEEKDGNPK